MWGLGAIRDGAAGLVKQGAGAVKQGVEAGAKLLENLDEVGKTAFPFKGAFLFFSRDRCSVSGSHGSLLSLGDEWWEERLRHWLTPLKCAGFLFLPLLSKVDRENPGNVLMH